METKKCIECGEEKELYHNFPLEGPGGKFRRNVCKTCIKKWNLLSKEERERIKSEKGESIRTRIEKTCPTCKEIKPREAFYKKKYNLDGMSTECKQCDNSRGRKVKKTFVASYLSETNISLTYKVCNLCGQEKEIRHFSRNVSIKSGHCGHCKQCARTRWKESMTNDRRITLLINRIRAKCNKEGIDFDLEPSDIIIPVVCPVLGIPLRFGQVNKGYTSHIEEGSPSVDRIDPTKGYVKHNIVIVSWRANRIKGNATIKELQRIAKFYRQFDGG